jgi:hypothetical protein
MHIHVKDTGEGRLETTKSETRPTIASGQLCQIVTDGITASPKYGFKNLVLYERIDHLNF